MSSAGPVALALVSFRVIPPGSAFLVVGDEGEETAVQAPVGGSKLTWSGPPLMPRDSPDRIGLELAAEGPSDLARLVRLGATQVGLGRYHDPDGNEVVVSCP